MKRSQNYCFFFLLSIEYVAHMLHFASDFLAQQLICCVHVFWLSVPYVPGDLEGIDSNLIVQKSQKRRSERGWNGEHLLVILSEAKDLVAQHARSFAEFTLSEANGLRMTLGGRFVSPRLMSRWLHDRIKRRHKV